MERLLRFLLFRGKIMRINKKTGKGAYCFMKLGIGDETTDSIFQCISLNADTA